MSRPEGDTTLTAMDRSGELPKAIAELGTGTRIGRYVVEARLGAGGMGVVYVARDTELARDVALKIVRPRGEVDVTQARLRREAKAMARLSHPNVVPVFDIGTHDGQLFIAMELVDGETLRTWVAAPRPWRTVVELFVKAGRGLEAAHAAGLLHRDFKPDNVVIGPGDEPRITDFGLARELADETSAATLLGEGSDTELSLITRTGSLAGTPAYMAPEQLLGRQAGAAADQFSFCVSLFEALHGTRPFRPAAPRPDALIPEIRAGRIVKPRRPVPGWLHAAIVRGLAFAPDRRWPSMTALLDRFDRRRRGRRVGVVAAVAGLVVVAAGTAAAVVMLRPDRPTASCLDVAAKGNDATTVVVCREEYARSNGPNAGLELANALRRSGKLQDAAIVANELLATPVRADALRLLGKIAVTDGHRDDAVRSLRLASQLHREQQRWGDAAADLQVLSGVLNNFIDQLVALNQAVADARRGGNTAIEGFCHVTIARILSEIGARSGALAELERASPLMMTRPDSAVQLDFERGNVYQNLGEDALAVPGFERALAGAEKVTNRRFALWSRHNLVYSLAGAGRIADASRELAVANALDPGDSKRATRLSLEAKIAEMSGDLSRAAALTDEALTATGPDATDDLIERHTERAEIALRRNDLAIVEQSARRAIVLIESTRSTEPPVELRSWMITEHRTPYQLLFAVMARRGDAIGALEVFERYRGLSVLAGLAHRNGAAAIASNAVYPIDELARLFPLLGQSPLASPASGRAIRDAVRDTSLLVLTVVHEELWRIVAQDGRLEVASLGPIAALESHIERLRVAPDDRAAAAALGAVFIPAALAHPSNRVLHVVLDESLVSLPLAALWVGDRRLIEARPIVRSARVADVGCAPALDGPRRVVVIGDSGHLGQRLRMTAHAATRNALFGAAHADLLHIAVPVEVDALDNVLVLRDGRVRSLEIAGHGEAPAQVVLAPSQTGPQGTASLAMAFLAAGAEQVIATVGPVPGVTLDQLADRLYGAQPGDLVHALARIQVTADGSGDDGAWLRVAAFGRELCHPQP